MEDVEDHPDNQTRFVSLARSGHSGPHRPRPHQHRLLPERDHPGSLYAILGQFAARNINLSKLESRPTKKALGDYCFIIDFEGHVADAVVGDCLPRSPRRAGRGQVPRLLSGGRAGRSGHPARGGHLAAPGRRVDRRAAGRDPEA